MIYEDKGQQIVKEINLLWELIINKCIEYNISAHKILCELYVVLLT